jgi:hypothetical protein
MNDLYGARVTSDGTVLDPQGLVISRAPETPTPRVSGWLGGFLVVWPQHTATGWDVYGARFTSSGDAIDTSAFIVSAEPTDEGVPVVAGDGNGHAAVAYQRLGADAQSQNPLAHARLIDPTTARYHVECGCSSAAWAALPLLLALVRLVARRPRRRY